MARPVARKGSMPVPTLLGGPGIRHAGASIDEAAITLRLPPVPLPRSAPLWRGGSVLGVAALVAGVMLFLGPPKAPRSSVSLAPAPALALEATPTASGQTVLASAAPRALELPDPALAPDELEEILIIDEDEEEDDVVILDDDDPPPRARRAKRARRSPKADRSFASRAPAARAAGLAQQAMKRRHYKSALRHAKRATRLAPRNAEYQLLLGDAYLLAKKRRFAKKAWRRAAAFGSAKAKDRLRV